MRPRRGVFDALFAFFDGWRGTLLTVFLAPLLVGLALWLPPVSISTRLLDAGYTTLPATGGALTLPDGATLNIRAEDLGGLPARVRFEPVSRDSIFDGTAQGAVEGSAIAIPLQLRLKSDAYVAETKDAPPAFSEWQLPLPADGTDPTELDVYRWDGQAWIWVPHRYNAATNRLESRLQGLPIALAVMQALQQPPQVSVTTGESLDFTTVRGATVLSALSPQVYFLQGDGAVGQAFTLGSPFQQSGTPVLPILSNTEPSGVVRTDLVDNLMVNNSSWTAHFDRLVAIVSDGGYEGLVIDYRGINPVFRDAFTLYIETLAQRLAIANKILIVRVDDPLRTSATDFDTRAYDWERLGAAATFLRIPIPPTFTYEDMNALGTFTIQRVNRYRVLFEMMTAPTAQVNGVTTAVTYTDVYNLAEGAAQEQLTTTADDAPYRVTVQEIEVVAENSATVERRLQTLRPFRMAGVTLVRSDLADPTVWERVAAYQSAR